MSKPHFTLTPCRCPRHPLSRHQIVLGCWGAAVLVLIVEGIVAYHLYWKDATASIMILTSWIKDPLKEALKVLVFKD